MLPETIKTDRLRFDAIRPESVDVFDLYEICSSDPGIDEITEYMTWDPHETPKEAQEFIERVSEQYEDADGVSYLIRPRGDAIDATADGAGDIAGTGGFGIDWEKRTMTMGVWFRKRFWGRGYSGERAAAFLELAFDRLDLEVVATAVHVDNDQSIRAIEKYVEAHGGRRDGCIRNHIVIDGDPADCYRYTISSEEWADNRSDLTVQFRD
ncbi:GNAT family N-acetyltransferase [Natronolimnobius baerhuensis]|uniref:GNAT family N-acetyltransferase n=1 Tax=Natronolimnobius baerhuensis TaxID=253108 RepID=UPI000B3F9386